jgi:nicotinamide phosphoribosyltransferase
MSGTEDATRAGIAHATQFQGSDSVHAAYAAKHIYGFKTPLFAASVPATEHSIMQLGISQESETETIRRLIKQYPSGILAVVCDTEDYWNTLTNILPSLKEEILARTPNSLGLAKFVVRPDSGNPTDVICGIKINQSFPTLTLAEAAEQTYMGSFYISCKEGCFKVIGEDAFELLSEAQVKGSIEILWDIFGGTINSKGYKVLNPKVGLIYGDSITPQRAYEICKRLQAKGFASSNVVFGIGLTI